LWILASDPPPAPYLAATLVGFLVGGTGHLMRSNALIAAGILIILGTMVQFIAATDPHFGG
jgi:hypothetical protein